MTGGQDARWTKAEGRIQGSMWLPWEHYLKKILCVIIDESECGILRQISPRLRSK